MRVQVSVQSFTSIAQCTLAATVVRLKYRLEHTKKDKDNRSKGILYCARQDSKRNEMSSRNLAKPNVVFSEKSLVKALSAVVGSFVSSSLFYPLNVARLQLQCNPNVAGNMKEGLVSNFAFVKVIHHIVNTQGLLALYQGWTANSLSLCLGSFVYFYLNSALQILYRRRRGGMDNKDLSYLAHIVVASISGMINVLITTPLWVATTRLTLQDRVNDSNSLDRRRHANPKKSVGSLQNFSTCQSYKNEEFKTREKGNCDLGRQSNDGSPTTARSGRRCEMLLGKPPREKNYSGVLDCLQGVYREGGVSALWSGLIPSLFLVSNPAIQTVVYEKVLIWYERLVYRQCAPVEFFAVAALAKAVATFFTYPLQVAQAQLQNHSESKTKFKNGCKVTSLDKPSLLVVLKKIFEEHGVLGLFAGLHAKLWQTVLNSAFMYMTYESLQRFIMRVLVGQRRRRRGLFNANRFRKKGYRGKM